MYVCSVKESVRQFGGHVVASSQKNKGKTFEYEVRCCEFLLLERQRQRTASYVA